MEPDQKEALIRELIDLGYFKNNKVLEAFRRVPREEFILPQYRKYAYINEPLPILRGQTISQPLTVVAMTEALDVKPVHKVLEVGTGSGYQAAILAELVGDKGKIVTTEIIDDLFEFAKSNLEKLDYNNLAVIKSDGSIGYKKEAPYDRIIVTASAPKIPQPLLEQLKIGGKMIIPVGNEMFLIEKQKGEFKKTSLGNYSFVPLTGKHGEKQ